MSWRRLLLAGVVLACLAAAAGAAVEWMRFGLRGDRAYGTVHAELTRTFTAMTADLGAVGQAIAADPATGPALVAARGLETGSDAARALFDALDRRLGVTATRSDVAVTIYDSPDGIARAWTGRPSDIPAERLRGSQAWFVTPSPQGLRLIHLVPVMAGDVAPVGVVATEQALSPATAAGSLAPAEYSLPTSVGPAALRLPYEGAGERLAPGAVLLIAPTGEVLVEASITAAQIAETRGEWRRRVVAVVLGIVSLTLLFLIGPVLDRRARGAAVTTNARSDGDGRPAARRRARPSAGSRSTWRSTVAPGCPPWC